MTAVMSTPAWLRWFSLFGLLCFSLMVFLGKANERSLQAMDSSVHARLALDITRGPLHLPVSEYSKGGHWPRGFNDHPFTMFYLSGKVMRALGPSAFSARLLATSFSVGCVVLTYLLALALGAGHAPALAAALMLTLTPQFVLYGARFHLDGPQCFFILLSFLAWVRGYPLLAGLSVGLGLITKTPVCPLLYPSVGLASLVQGTLFKHRTWLKLAGALLVSIGVAFCFWAYCAHLAGWEIVTDYFTRHVIGVAADTKGLGHVPRLPLLLQLTAKFHLWALLFFAGLAYFVKEKRWRTHPSLNLLLAATLVEVAAITGMNFRLEHYYLPAYPFAILFGVLSFAEFFRRRALAVNGAALGLSLALGTAALAFPLNFGDEKFPQLRAFNPLIRAQGDCRDLVLFVQGSQPYGSYGDYAAEVSFYTNRRLHWATCENLAQKMAELKPAWVIVGEEELKACGAPLEDGFPGRYRYGAQLLLSQYSPAPGGVDLTPLSTAAMAPADCEMPTFGPQRFFKPSAEIPSAR